MFAVDLGAWSVKLAIASPGIRGATLINVVERLVPPGDEPLEQRRSRRSRRVIEELRLARRPGYIGVYGDQVFTQVLEFGFKNLRRAELDKAVGGELEGVVPVDLEDMVYAFEPIPRCRRRRSPARGVQRGRVAPPAEGMRVLTYAMRRDRAEHLIELGKQARLRAARPARVRRRRGPARRAHAVAGAGAHRRRGRRDRHRPRAHRRRRRAPAARRCSAAAIARAGKQVTEAIARHWKLPWADAERAKHTDGFVASPAEPATSEAWARIHQVTITELDAVRARPAPDARGVPREHRVRADRGAPRRRRRAAARHRLVPRPSSSAIPAWRPTADDVVALAGPRLGADAAEPRRSTARR